MEIEDGDGTGNVAHQGIVLLRLGRLRPWSVLRTLGTKTRPFRLDRNDERDIIYCTFLFHRVDSPDENVEHVVLRGLWDYDF